MLGQLLHSLNASTRRPPPRSRTLDSVNEDSHTFGLLFPGVSFVPDHDGSPQSFPNPELTQSLPPQRGAAASLAAVTTDHIPDSAELDLEHPRDIRVLIAQAGTTGTQEGLPLFDSKPAPPPTPADSPRLTHSRGSSRNENIGPFTAPAAAVANAIGTPGGARGAAGRAGSTVPPIQEDHRHRRTSSSLSNTAAAAATSGLGAFQRARARRGSLSSVHSFSEGPGRTEGEDVERIALGCMFENMMSSYKGTSNKVHIIPLVAKPYDSSLCSTSLTNDFGSLSLARPPVIRRPSSLSRSHVPGDQPDPEMNLADAVSQNQPGRRIVLVTRTFSITWVDDEVADERQAANSSPKDTPERPTRLPRRRTNRSPMFAITIILHLPISPSESSPPVSRTGTFGRKSSRKDSTSRSHASLASSMESDRRGPSYLIDPLFGEGLAASFSSDVDDKVDLIGQHWDVISRTLTTLQSLVQNKILALLKPLSLQQRPTRLARMALALDQDVKRAVDDGCIRIIRGMKIPRVHAGHGQWGAWREEARWLKNWAGKKEDNFLPILISAFLGTHTDWLHTLAPKWYRRRYREQHRQSVSDSSVPCRTVILAADKMAARRIIFILSAFLPSDTARGDASPLRPSTAASFRAYSQSPPKLHGINRKESLRRVLNRKGKAGVSHTGQPISRTSSISAAPESLDDRTETGTVRGEDSLDGTARLADDTQSKLSKTEMDPSGQKSSTTTSTAPASVEIRPFFSRRPSMGQSAQSTHSRTSSAASATLIQPLTRTATTGEPPRPTRWGSLRSLWSIASRRESATEYSEVLQTTDEGLGIAGVRNMTSPTKLQKMVDELHGIATEVVVDSQSSTTDSQHPTAFPSPELHGGDGSGTSPEQESSPAHARKFSQPIDVPLKLSVNKDDGVIDVEVPFPDFGSPPLLIPPAATAPLPLAPFSPSTGAAAAALIFPGSHSNSPSYAGSSAPSHHSMSLAAAAATMSPRDGAERAPNVAGWLDRVHPDFTLQAVRPYADALRDIRAAMSAEPNPPMTAATTMAAWRAADATTAAAAGSGGAQGPTAPTERWLDVCTALVADAATRTVRRLRLRRRVRFVRHQAAFAPPLVTTPATPAGMGIVGSPGVRSLYGNPYSQHPLPPLGGGGSGAAAGATGAAAAGPGGMASGMASSIAAAGAAASSEFTLEERFLEETVAEADPVFAEALERAIWPSGGAAAAATAVGDEVDRTLTIAAAARPGGGPSSRSSSSRRGRPAGEHADDTPSEQRHSATVGPGGDHRGRHRPAGELAPAALTMTPASAVAAVGRDARGIIVGALEGLAAEVAVARVRHGAGAGAGGADGATATAESALREGVRVWMEEVEAVGDAKDGGLREEMK